MTQIPVKDYIEKILILEKSSNRIKKYSLFEPLKTNDIIDLIEIQKIVKLLSQHIGYDKLVFTVSFSEFGQNENTIQSLSSFTAGNILLDNNEDVLIHISREIMNYPELVLATLSHEISHKYIHFNNLTFKNIYENEVFTDLTAVFLGFGKLMLNGVNVKKEINLGDIKKTHEKSVGYLNRNQLAFIYLAVNYMYGECKTNQYSFLNKEALESVNQVEKEYKTFFKEIKFYSTKIQKINSLKFKLAYLMKVARLSGAYRLSDSKISNDINTYLYKEFTHLNLIENRLIYFKKEFLLRILFEPKKSNKIRNEIPLVSIDINGYKSHLKRCRRKFPKNDKDFFENHDLKLVECLSCKTPMRLKSNNIGVIVCPACNFSFTVDTLNSIKNVSFIHMINRKIDSFLKSISNKYSECN